MEFVLDMINNCKHLLKTYGDLVGSLTFQGFLFHVINFNIQPYFPLLPPQAIGQRWPTNPSPLCMAWIQVVQWLGVRRRRVSVRGPNSFHVFLKLFFSQANKACTGRIMANDVWGLGTFIFTVEISGKKNLH